MTVRMRFLGAAGYEIVAPGGGRILIDPFLTGNPVAPCAASELERPDVILVTHGAPDHLGDAGEIAARTGAPVVGGADVRALLLDRGLPPSQVQATIWGIVVEVGGFVVRPVESHHWSSVRLASGAVVTGTPLGFIVEPEPGVRIYHWGDSAIFGDLRMIAELYRPTVAIVGPTHPKEIAVLDGPGRLLTGEMSPAEAALAVEWLAAPIAVASHYLDADDPEIAEFRDLVAARDPARVTVAPRPGEAVVVDGGRATVESA
jgi:L-ascorbate metabolism protein UlaG (beta-lactamase superfamily)